MFLFRLLIATFLAIEGRFWRPSVFQKLRQSRNLSQFFDLLEANKGAKLDLQYGEITVFAPINEAFEGFNGEIDDLVYYHLVWYSKVIEELDSHAFVTSVLDENPPLWITKVSITFLHIHYYLVLKSNARSVL